MSRVARGVVTLFYHQTMVPPSPAPGLRPACPPRSLRDVEDDEKASRSGCSPLGAAPIGLIVASPLGGNAGIVSVNSLNQLCEAARQSNPQTPSGRWADVDADKIGVISSGLDGTIYGGSLLSYSTYLYPPGCASEN